MAHKAVQLERTESNRAAHSRLYKVYLAHRGLIRCERCSYHKGENTSRRVLSNWKASRRTKWRPAHAT